MPFVRSNFSFTRTAEEWPNIPLSIGVLDIDGDDDLDFIVGYWRSPATADQDPTGLDVYLNNGSGVFSDGTNALFPDGVPTNHEVRQIVIADFNGDGRPDVFFADQGPDVWPYPGGQNTLILSSGTHDVVDATASLPQSTDFTHSSAAGDIDGDGDIDLIVMNVHGGEPPGTETAPHVLLNDGFGQFTRIDSYLPTSVFERQDEAVNLSCLLFDADNDDDLDLFLGNSASGINPSLILFNSGNGDFSHSPESELPLSTISPVAVLDSQALDLNGDGFLDLVLSHGAGLLRTIQVLINDGTGQFTDESHLRLPQPFDESGHVFWRINLTDLNGDGHIDLIPTNDDTPPIFLNDGTGHFVKLPASVLEYTQRQVAPYSPEWDAYDSFSLIYPMDVNGDGRMDILGKRASYGETFFYGVFINEDPGLDFFGTDGSDALLGDSDPETISGLLGDDVVFAGAGNDTLNGDSGVDYLNGGSGNDSLNGGSGNDSLNGGFGLDYMLGGLGADTMLGGAGSDTYIVDNAGDKVYETTLIGGVINAGGNDLVLSSVTFKITGFIEKLTLTGNGVISGTGNNLANKITGNNAGNALIGLNGADTLNGSGGDDQLRGGTGNDSLTGGTGLDKFRFDTVPTATNIDTITDFNVADDTIQLENSIFTTLAATGGLAPGNFRANLTGLAQDANDYVIYETDTGKLFYDADGLGGVAGVQIATLVGMPVLTNADILIV